MMEQPPQNFDACEPSELEEFMHDVRNGYGDNHDINTAPPNPLDTPENSLWNEEVEEVIESTLGSYEEPKLKSGDILHLGGETYKLEVVDWAGGGLLAKNTENNTGTIMSFYSFAQRVLDDTKDQ